MPYERFIFESFHFDHARRCLTLLYSLDEKILFEEELLFPEGINYSENQLREKLFFNLHLIAGISYYKTYCPKKIEVRSGRLSGGQAAFWDKLYTKGLGQFFYEHKIDFHGLIRFPSTVTETELVFKEKTGRNLLAIGGGKDSLVSAELLKENGFDFDLFTLGDHVLFQQTEHAVGKRRIIVERKISPELFRLNRQGAYNGHIPISAYTAFLGITAAALYGYDDIIFSNSTSSNEENLVWLEEEINHQYSKSLEFEADLQDYVRNFITPDIEYFSLLRPCYELKIIEIFSRYDKYFSIFSSCNRNFTQKGDRTAIVWCGRCPKCAFIFLMLAAFLPKEKVINIFGKNLLDADSLLETYEKLLGEREHKPFDCVGTRDEVYAAFFLVRERGEFDDTLAVKYFTSRILPKIVHPKLLLAKILQTPEVHRIPKKFLGIVEKIYAPS